MPFSIGRKAERLFDHPRLYRAKFQVTGFLLRTVKPVLFKTSVSAEDLIASARIQPGARICEIGSGDGENFRTVLGMCGDVKYTGIDINPAMVAHCQQEYPAQQWLQAYPPYPFGDASFDYCLIVNVLHHLNSRKEAIALLTEARRIAGVVLLFEPLQSEGAALSALKSLYWALTDGGNRYLRLSEMRALIAETGAAPAWERASAPLRHFYGARIPSR